MMEIESRSQWDALWTKSSATMPTMQANVFSLTCDFFHAGDRMHMIVSKDNSGWVGVLPLALSYSRLTGSNARLCAPHWLFEGMLFDPAKSLDCYSSDLCEQLRCLSANTLKLQNIPFENTLWQSFQRSALERRMATNVTYQIRHGLVNIDGQWDAYLQSIPRSKRTETQRRIRRLSEQGELRLHVLSEIAPSDVAHWVKRGFELEHQGWKGRAGSSVIARGYLRYLVHQAELLAATGHLRIYFLEHLGVPIAFAYVPYAKGTLHYLKHAYDENYAKYGPGQILLYMILEHAFQSPEIYKKLDMCGPLTEALKGWETSSFSVGDVAIGLNRLGSAAVLAHQRLKPMIRRSREWLKRVIFRTKHQV